MRLVWDASLYGSARSRALGRNSKYLKFFGKFLFPHLPDGKAGAQFSHLMKICPPGAALFCALLLSAFSGFAREGTPPLSRQQPVGTLNTVQQLVLPATDRRAELSADARIGVRTPLRFAAPEAVWVTPATHGTWEQVRGGRLWRLRVISAGATELNFGFISCWLPEAATLHVYSEDEDYVQGPYGARDNKPHGQLWTPVLPGARAVIELFVPAGATEEPRLVLSQINRGYRDMFHRQKDLGTPKAAESCEIDAVCPQGDPWRNEIRSVARYSINGTALCTGTLINNVSNNFRNYFLTATHCLADAASAATVVVYWKYQAATCGQRGVGSLAQNQSGAICRMAKADVDVTLIELDDIPDSNFRVYYSGWDRSGTAPPGAVGIHHPGGFEKCISFANGPLSTGDNCIGGTGINTHWQVTWDAGVTEPGSSGSGIWDPNTHRLVGTLSGGGSDCSTPFDSDCYGKFSLAWNSGTTPATRLRDWLDPANTGVSTMGGRDPQPVLIVSAGSSLFAEGCSPTNGVIDPGETVTVSFSFQNIGASNSVNLTATLLATNGVTSPSAPQNYGVVVANGAAVARSFSFVASGTCGGVITPTLQLQDGTNNFGPFTFPFRLGTPLVTFTQNFDAVSIPGLPTGWSNAASGSTGWRTVASLSHTTPNSVFSADPANLSDAALTSPLIPISSSTAQVKFAHSYDTESGSEPFDGGVLEISYNNGPFNDIIAAGGSFFSGGYNGVISTRYSSPIAGRRAWSGNSGGFVTTIANQ